MNKEQQSDKNKIQSSQSSKRKQETSTKNLATTQQSSKISLQAKKAINIGKRTGDEVKKANTGFNYDGTEKVDDYFAKRQRLSIGSDFEDDEQQENHNKQQQLSNQDHNYLSAQKRQSASGFSDCEDGSEIDQLKKLKRDSLSDFGLSPESQATRDEFRSGRGQRSQRSIHGQEGISQKSDFEQELEHMDSRQNYFLDVPSRKTSSFRAKRSFQSINKNKDRNSIALSSIAKIRNSNGELLTDVSSDRMDDLELLGQISNLPADLVASNFKENSNTPFSKGIDDFDISLSHSDLYQESSNNNNNNYNKKVKEELNGDQKISNKLIERIKNMEQVANIEQSNKKVNSDSKRQLEFQGQDYYKNEEDLALSIDSDEEDLSILIEKNKKFVQGLSQRKKKNYISSSSSILDDSQSRVIYPSIAANKQNLSQIQEVNTQQENNNYQNSNHKYESITKQKKIKGNRDPKSISKNNRIEITIEESEYSYKSQNDPKENEEKEVENNTQKTDKQIQPSIENNLSSNILNQSFQQDITDKKKSKKEKKDKEYSVDSSNIVLKQIGGSSESDVESQIGGVMILKALEENSDQEGKNKKQDYSDQSQSLVEANESPFYPIIQNNLETIIEKDYAELSDFESKDNIGQRHNKHIKKPQDPKHNMEVEMELSNEQIQRNEEDHSRDHLISKQQKKQQQKKEKRERGKRKRITPKKYQDNSQSTYSSNTDNSRDTLNTSDIVTKKLKNTSKNSFSSSHSQENSKNHSQSQKHKQESNKQLKERKQYSDIFERGFHKDQIEFQVNSESNTFGVEGRYPVRKRIRPLLSWCERAVYGRQGLLYIIADANTNNLTEVNYCIPGFSNVPQQKKTILSQKKSKRNSSLEISKTHSLKPIKEDVKGEEIQKQQKQTKINNSLIEPQSIRNHSNKSQQQIIEKGESQQQQSQVQTRRPKSLSIKIDIKEQRKSLQETSQRNSKEFQKQVDQAKGRNSSDRGSIEKGRKRRSPLQENKNNNKSKDNNPITETSTKETTVKKKRNQSEQKEEKGKENQSTLKEKNAKHNKRLSSPIDFILREFNFKSAQDNEVEIIDGNLDHIQFKFKLMPGEEINRSSINYSKLDISVIECSWKKLLLKIEGEEQAISYLKQGDKKLIKKLKLFSILYKERGNKLPAIIQIGMAQKIGKEQTS